MRQVWKKSKSGVNNEDLPIISFGRCIHVSSKLGMQDLRKGIWYERCGMGSQANGVDCGVVEWVKRNTLRWFGYIERMGSREFVKKVCVSESMDLNNRGKPPRRWKDRIKEGGGGLD